MKQVFSFILLLSCAFFVTDAQNSSMKKIKQQQQATEKAIKETSKKLQSNTVKTKKSLNQLNLIEAEMNVQEKTISTIASDLRAIDGQLNAINISITANEAKLASMRSNYAKALKSMSVHSSAVDRLLFLFSSSSFHQAYRRMRYLKQFSKWRAKQAQQIQAVQNVLIAQHNQIKQYHDIKSQNLNKQNLAKLTLAQKQEEQKKTVASLKQQGKELQSFLSEKKRQAQNLDRQLDRLIAEEERKAAERARKQQEEEQKRQLAEEQKRQDEAKKAANKTVPEKSSPEKKVTPKPKDENKSSKDLAYNAPSKNLGGYQMSEQERTLSGSFESNKGKLLFPVSGTYRIVKPFGRQRHPELRYVETDNGGIDIETSPGASARAVFNGVVSGVFRQDGFNTVVMVRHGNYLTIYVNLSEIYVNTGEQIKANQAIGKIFSDPEDNNRTILHFEVRRERTKLNPQEWVR